MDVELIFHFELTDEGQPAWWIEVPEVEGFYSAGPTVTETRLVALTALAEVLGAPPSRVRESLADADAVASQRDSPRIEVLPPALVAA